MSDSSSSYVSSLLGTAETYADSLETTASSDLDKEDFLTLLVAQLANQDPLNPMENTEFVSQLAQYSSLEELITVNDNLETLVSTSEQSQLLSAISFVGKHVMASGDTTSVTEGESSEIYFDLYDDATSCYINIYDSDGDLVRTMDMGVLSLGSYSKTWDGLDDDGNQVDDGIYTLSIAAENADGESIDTTMSTEGTVSGISISDSSYTLTLSDGREVDLWDVEEITE